MHNFHITLSMTQNCVLIVIAHSGCWVGMLSGGCYGLLLVPMLEILNGGAKYLLDPVWRRPKGLTTHIQTDRVIAYRPIISSAGCTATADLKLPKMHRLGFACSIPKQCGIIHRTQFLGRGGNPFGPSVLLPPYFSLDFAYVCVSRQNF